MSLREELLKAKLINKKQLKKIEHEERLEKKQLGREGVKQKEEKRFAEIEQKLLEQRKKDKELAKEQQKEEQEKQKISQISDIILQNRLSDKSAGNNKFYFVAANGKMPFLLLSDSVCEKLERGQAAIVEWKIEQSNDDFFIVDHDCINKLRCLSPDIVRFCNK